ncbi:MAG: dCTP deaminase [DPANN group archaeon]|nr:dCTP deaminase [DPANN group archaeon]
MAFLSGEEILELIKTGQLKIEPFDRGAMRQLHFELKLGNKFTTLVSAGSAFIDPADPKFKLGEDTILTSMQKFTAIEVHDGGSYAVAPGEFVIGVTKEKIVMPNNYTGILNARASLGRLGLQVFCSGGFVDPNFSGFITLEIFNANKIPIVLKPGMPIVKLSMEKLNKTALPQGPALSSFVDIK